MIFSGMIKRPDYIKKISDAVGRSPVTALLGPRQCGKTTLARMFGGDSATYFDLELPSDQQRLSNPELILGDVSGLVILDEIQVIPELFNILRALVDRKENQARFLILGSASPTIIKNVSESLAGRIEFVELHGFDLSETGHDTMTDLWVKGSFPLSYLASSAEDSLAWRNNFIRTFLERDIPQLGINIPALAMRRFWTMLAHLHGQTWNASAIGRSMGLSDKTVRHYLDILTGTFMLRQVQPWFENINKRQVRAPKVFLRDSGILHALLSIPDINVLTGHPRLGASWEGFALEQFLSIVRPGDAYFWATYSGAELDLFFFSQGKRYGVEFKFNDAPSTSKSMRVAIDTLGLHHLYVVYPGKKSYPLDELITVLSIKDLKLVGRKIPFG